MKFLLSVECFAHIWFRNVPQCNFNDHKQKEKWNEFLDFYLNVNGLGQTSLLNPGVDLKQLLLLLLCEARLVLLQQPQLLSVLFQYFLDVAAHTSHIYTFKTLCDSHISDNIMMFADSWLDYGVLAMINLNPPCIYLVPSKKWYANNT